MTPPPRRPVILTSASHYLPGFRAGGPVRSIAHLVEHLADEFDFRILTSDRDLGDDAPYAGVEPDRWVSVGRAQVHYTSPAQLTPLALARIIRAVPHDLLYLNSFFAPRFSILPLVLRRLGVLAGVPTVMAPRGEFSEGALALKATKKRGYLALGRAFGLFRNLRWQASSEFEARDIFRLIGDGANVEIACDLTAELDDVTPVHVARGSGEPLRIVFVSRISPKKNLDYALKVLSQVCAPIQFTICGPAEDADYVKLCRALAAQLGSHVRVEWADAVPADRIGELFAAHDLFLFPTRGENFGHVIAEALAAGTPVLVSDATPWRGLAAAGVGEDLPLSDPAAFAARIDTLAGEGRDAAAARRARAVAFIRARQQQGGDVLANRLLFRRALGAQSANRSD